MSILKDIVKFYNGDIQLYSELNKNYMEKSWVNFKVSFNNIRHFKKIKSEIKSKISNTSIFKNKLKILISDDEVFFIEHFKNIFNDYPECIKVNYTYTASEACEIINNNKIDLAILDLKLAKDEIGCFKIIEKLDINYTYILIHSSSYFRDYHFLSTHISEFVQKTNYLIS